MRALAAAGVGAVVLAASAVAATPQVTGSATIASQRVTLRYATAFEREGATRASGAYAILLTPRPVRCRDVKGLPDENALRQPWALVALFPTRDGSPGAGRVNGELNYPVGSAYAVLARNVSIVLADAVPFPGAVWSGRVSQPMRVVEGASFSVRARFKARWCP